MDPQSFASDRGVRLEAADAELESFVRAALTRWGDDDWDTDLVEAAQVLWLEIYAKEAPHADHERDMAKFTTLLRDSLAQTSDPEHPAAESQVTLITQWISTFTVNDATWRGTAVRGGKFTRWTTMHDAAVRDTHAATDGQIRSVGGTFSVGGYDLHYPGEPVGPPEIWINCRCLAMPAAHQGEAMSGTTYTIGPEDEVEENPDVVLGSEAFADVPTEPIEVQKPDDAVVDDTPADGEELITEIPVHGVLAPEGVSTGDGRKFALGSLSVRDLPVPLRYEVVSTHGGQTSDVVTVGRIDQAWRDDASNSWRFTGAIVLTKPHAQEVIDGIVDGTVRGTSIDGDMAEIEMTPMDPDAEEGDLSDVLEAMFNPGETVFSKMRVAGLTIVAIPAFQEAYISLGHEFQEDLTDEDRQAQIAALQACGCMDGWGIVDVSESEEDNAKAALEAALLDDGFRDVPTEERKRLADKGAAMPDGSYPIANCDDLKNAIQAIGRAKDPEATKAHIRKRKSALGCPDVELPDTWGLVELDTFAPGTHDGPGWITHPIPTARIRRYWVRGEGALKIKWGVPGDFNRCRSQLAKYVQNPDWLAGLCANMHHEALGFWPAQHHGSRVIVAAGSALASPAARLVEPESEAYPSEWFAEPTDFAPMRIDKETRRIYGYAAEWGTCHVGVPGFCEEVPKSYSDYAYFKKGLVDTDAGEQPVGVISYGTGHADVYSRIAVATAHYDRPDAVRAYVNIGENARGIWYAGVLAPWTTDEDIAAMRAIGAVSGDWRDIRGEYELIGIPVVNTPGYPVKATITASAGRQISLIGAGALSPEPKTATFTMKLDADTVAGIARTAVTEYIHQEKIAARAEPARARVRQRRLEAARARASRS